MLSYIFLSFLIIINTTFFVVNFSEQGQEVFSALRNSTVPNSSSTQNKSLMLTPLIKLISRKVHAYVNMGIILVECLREIDERES
jgi:hypothetical protein